MNTRVSFWKKVTQGEALGRGPGTVDQNNLRRAKAKKNWLGFQLKTERWPESFRRGREDNKNSASSLDEKH